MREDEPKTGQPDNDTTRLEAFSDGVFAIAITLLVLNLTVPLSGQLKGSLLRALLDQWPDYLAYLISFLFILIMWINHHTLFKYIARSDHTLLLLNGLLLLFIALVPFPTRLLAEYLKPGVQAADQRVAALEFNGIYVLLALVFNALWRYAAHNRRLIGDAIHSRHVDAVTRDYRFGPLFYLVAFILAFVNVWASLAVNVGLALFFALPRARRRP
jgi:uncharacterized membrane protein